MAAPICHLPDGFATPQPDAPALPSIPLATDLPSALAAINGIRQWIAQQQPKKGFSEGVKTKPDPKPQSKDGRWVEASRETKTEKIYNPNNRSQYIEVERINKLTMRDRQTGEKWVWNRGK